MMKQLIQFVFPTLKAVCGVIGFIGTLTIGAYMTVKGIAITEAGVMESRIMAVRSADMNHLNDRFDRTDKKLDSILKELKK